MTTVLVDSAPLGMRRWTASFGRSGYGVAHYALMAGPRRDPQEEEAAILVVGLTRTRARLSISVAA